jgi:hypothetical protein
MERSNMFIPSLANARENKPVIKKEMENVKKPHKCTLSKYTDCIN